MTDETVPADPRPRVRRWPLISALIALITVALCLITAWSGIWASHPAYWSTLLLVTGISGAMIWWARRTPTPTALGPFRFWLPRAALVLGTLLTVLGVLYLRPLVADGVAVDAMPSGDGVEVDDSMSSIRFTPTDPKGTGLVFYPGAKVDPRAYTRLLRPLAEAGYTVVVIKFPYNLAVFGVDAADDVNGDDDGVDRWIVGGHSLGGAMAASYAMDTRDELAGLLLWAAYPAPGSSGSEGFTGLDVTSVFGSEDQLATVDDIALSKAMLPADTHFVEVEGGIHAFFGDYGTQNGDGTATISRDDAQAQIVAATLEQLDRVDAG
jgi:predicted alpha/beta-hydrolase family hydrolase